VRDLAARVHARVGSSRHGQRRRLGKPQDPPQRLFDCLLDGGLTWLGRPAVEGRAVVAQVQPEPQEVEPGRCFLAPRSGPGAVEPGQVIPAGLACCPLAIRRSPARRARQTPRPPLRSRRPDR
jgi:hypothetical protein